MDQIEDIKMAAADDELSASSKIIWMLLFFEHEYESFTTVYSDIAKVFGINEWTLKSNMRILMRRGAIRVLGTYDKKGRSGSSFELVPPQKWD